MSTLSTDRTDAASVPTQRDAAGRKGPDAADSTVAAAAPRRLLGSYLGYVGYFVGAGLISGGIVHFPLDPVRYLVLALVGAVVFVGATLVNEVLLPGTRAGRPPLVRVVAASLLLSLGIGMLSGGIAHFLDFPVRGAVLVPLGLLSSFIAFVVREVADPADALVSATGAVVLGVAVVMLFGLGQLALGLQASEAGHGHDHASAGHAATVTAPVG